MMTKCQHYDNCRLPVQLCNSKCKKSKENVAMSEPYVLEKTKGERFREEADKIKRDIDAEIEYCIENGQYRKAGDLINRLRELI